MRRLAAWTDDWPWWLWLVSAVGVAAFAVDNLLRDEVGPFIKTCAVFSLLVPLPLLLRSALLTYRGQPVTPLRLRRR